MLRVSRAIASTCLPTYVKSSGSASLSLSHPPFLTMSRGARNDENLCPAAVFDREHVAGKESIVGRVFFIRLIFGAALAPPPKTRVSTTLLLVLKCRLFSLQIRDAVDPISLAQRCAELCRGGTGGNDTDTNNPDCGFFNFQVQTNKTVNGKTDMPKMTAIEIYKSGLFYSIGVGELFRPMNSQLGSPWNFLL